jgi:hypothetical protein
MKKKVAIGVSVLLVLIIVALVYYITPKTFGKGINPANVDHINVFDGNTGEGFTIENADDIRYIVENIQSKPMRRDGVSLGHMGWKFSIVFVDKNDKAIVPIFFINSDNTIRKDPFFYRCDGGLCIDYLDELENKIVNATE